MNSIKLMLQSLMHSLSGNQHLQITAFPIAVILVVDIAAANGWPFLLDEPWQDEAATILNYTNKVSAYPFTYYPAPNNHMLLVRC